MVSAALPLLCLSVAAAERSLTSSTATVADRAVAAMAPVHVVGLRRFIDPTATTAELGPAAIAEGLRRGQGLGDLLESVPGASVSDEGGPLHARRLRLRGATAAETKVLVDGLPIAQPFATGLDLGAFSLDDLERVAVVRGGAGASGGDGAIGGAVLLSTKPPERSPRAWARGLVGTEASYGLAAGAAKGPLRLSLSGQRTSGEFPYVSHIEGLPDEARVRQNNDATVGGGSLRFRSALGEGRLDLNAAAAVREGGVAGLETQSSLVARERRLSGLLSSSFQKRARPSSPGFMVSLHLSALEVAYTDPESASSRAGFWAVGLASSLSLELGSHRAQLGLEGQTELASLEGGAQPSLGRAQLWASDELSLGEHVLFAALRGVFGSQGADVLPRAGLRLSLASPLSLTLALGRARRAPTIDELYHPIENGLSGNPALVPERAWEGELSVALTDSPVSGGAAFFLRRTEEAIAYVHLNAFMIRPENLGATRAIGGELWLKGQGELGQVGLRGSAAASLAATEDETTHQPSPGAPLASLDLGAAVQLGASAEDRPFEVYTRLHAASSATANPSGTIRVPPYLRWDLGVGWHLGSTLSANISLTNVLDDRRLTSLHKIPLPGRALIATLQAALGEP